MELRFDILLFPQGKNKAFTLSYDDGVIQDKKFIELLDKYNLKGTFNLNSGTFGQVDRYPHLAVDHVKVQEAEVKEMYKGHEVAVHTVTHPNLAAVPDGMISYEVSCDRHNLEKLVGYQVRGMAYPFGTYNTKVISVLENTGIEYSRTVASTHNFNIPENFLAWNPTCHHDDDKLIELADSFLDEANKFMTSLKLFYVWGHTYEFDNNNNWDRIEEFFKKISNHDSVWYATNIEIVDYLNAAKQLRYSADGTLIYNPTAIDIWINILGNTYKIGSGLTININTKKNR